MTLNKTIIAMIVTAQALIMSGCSDDKTNNTATTTTAAESATPTTGKDPHAGMNLRLAANQGKVLQSSNGGGYTYAEVDQNGNKFWIAGAEAPLKPGDIVTWGQAQEMTNVNSKVLNRTFDSIYFVSDIATNRTHTTINTGQQQTAANDNNSGKVISAQSAAGYTYLQIQSAAGERWVAVPQMQAKAGQTVMWTGASVMRDFTSKALNKTFSEIIFAGQARVIDASAVPTVANNANNATQGKVITVKSGGGYSYVEVETAAGNKWVAAPQIAVAVGDTVTWSGASVMTNFTSSSLGQTFDEILFAGSISKVN
jgi:plastocyanin